MATAQEPEPEVIEIIQETLNNQMAAVMLVCGAVAGAFLLYVFLEYQKQQRTLNSGTRQIEYPQPIEMIPEPSLQGQNDTRPAFEIGA
jgi:hypothetical protein